MPTTAARAQVLADSRSADPDRSRDLPLAHAKGVAQSEDFANLAHRRSLGGHRISPRVVTTGDRVRDSIADSESFTPASQGGRLRSEWVADFHRNRWPDCVGITGRFASDYGVRHRRAPDRVSDAPCTHVAQQEDVAMRTLDLTPLWRSTVGFDRLADLLDESARWMGEENYPPYNIERTGEDHYQISLALAGFAPEEITITAEQNVLTIEGGKAEKAEHQYLYQGISARPFRQVFSLADYVQVKGASFEGGLLKIELVREVPEAMKPRRIAINASNDNRQIEQKKAA